MSKVHHKGIDLSDLLPCIREKTIENIKHMLKLAWDEFVFGGHLLALGASGIILTATILLEEKPSLILLLLGYALAQVVYSYDHFQDIKKDALTNPARAAHFKKEKYFQLTFPVYCLLLLGSLFYLKSLALALIVFLILAGGLLSAKTAKKLTQVIPGFKNFYVAFFWALLTILTILYYDKALLNLFTINLFLFVFLRWIVNTTFFDIKDIKGDKRQKFKTIPVLFGKNKTLAYLHLVNFIAFIPLVIAISKSIIPGIALFLLIFYLYGFLYLKQAKEKNNVYNLSYIIVDGEYILWPIALLVGKLFF